MTSTTELAEYRGDTYRDFAVMHDLDAKMLNRQAERDNGRDPYPFEVSGDALARYKATHP
ncbi:hypothetical protein [Brevibacterium pigmentatum]|uniref:hypothetical protein n=1 Tax=Brevibacterium pigmentatum TaxID=1496080 RepID=UPI00141DD9B0|nr:hypothetical protein [Brevibacterium pigmentatum]